jgi:hypothetical protein
LEFGASSILSSETAKELSVGGGEEGEVENLSFFFFFFFLSNFFFGAASFEFGGVSSILSSEAEEEGEGARGGVGLSWGFSLSSDFFLYIKEGLLK